MFQVAASRLPPSYPPRRQQKTARRPSRVDDDSCSRHTPPAVSPVEPRAARIIALVLH